MTALIVILIILLLIVVLLQIRVGAVVEYSEEGFEASAKVAGKKIRIFPRPKKTRSQKEKAEKKKQKKKEKKQKKAEKKKKKKKPKKEEAPKKKGGMVELVIQLIPIIGSALGALKKRIRIDPLTVHFTAGCEDAADTALLYGSSSGVAGVVVALMEENFDVREREVTIDMDFLAGHSTIYIRAGVSIKIGQVLYLAIRYGVACLKVYLKKNKKDKQNSNQKKKTEQAAEAKP